MKQSPLLSPRARQTIRQGWWMIPGIGLFLLASIFLSRNLPPTNKSKPIILVQKEAFPPKNLPLPHQLSEVAQKADWQTEAQQLRQVKMLSSAQKNRLHQLQTADSLLRQAEDLATRLSLRGEEPGFLSAPYQRALDDVREQLQRMNLSTH